MDKGTMLKNNRKSDEAISDLGMCADNRDDLIDYLEKKARGHNSYKFYSRKEYINDFLDGKLYLNDGKDWNDRIDREMFNPEGKKFVNFGKCFSFSHQENAAMWIIYSAGDENAAMIDIKRKLMMRILNETEEIQLGQFKDGEFAPEGKTLKKGEFEIMLFDILYYTEQNNQYFIKRSNDFYRKASNEVIAGLQGLRKDYAWNFENECRLIVRVNKKDVDAANHSVRIKLGSLKNDPSVERKYDSPFHNDIINKKQPGSDPKKAETAVRSTDSNNDVYKKSRLDIAKKSSDTK